MGGYTNITTGALRILYEARASAREIIAYAMLTRYHNDEEHPARCWVSAQMASEALGMTPDGFAKALNGLTRKTFAYEGGYVPVLTKVSDGHNGRAAVYNDNAYAVATLRDPRQVACRNQRATSFQQL